LESEAAQLRKQVLDLTEELKDTKNRLNEANFERIRREEELKALDQKNLKIQYDLRHLEGIEEDNRELHGKLSQLRSEYESLTAQYSAEVEALRESAKHEVQAAAV
jgi:hypothetical protein